VKIVLTADFSWSYIAFVGWVGSMCTLPWVGLGWVCSSVGWVGLGWVEENGPMSTSGRLSMLPRLLPYR